MKKGKNQGVGELTDLNTNNNYKGSCNKYVDELGTYVVQKCPFFDHVQCKNFQENQRYLIR